MVTAEKIRKTMRITHSLLDSEIQNNIEVALSDMDRVGINVKTENKLIDKACELYCKAEYNYQEKGEEYMKKYEAVRDSLCLSGSGRIGRKSRCRQ